MLSIRCRSATKYNWKVINYPSGKDDWKEFQKKNPKIYLNVFYVKKMNIYSAYISKYKLIQEKQIILLMITNREGWHYCAVKKLSTLLRRINSKHVGDFHCLIRLLLFRTKTINLTKNHVKIKYFCGVTMPSEETKILEFNQYRKYSFYFFCRS